MIAHRWLRCIVPGLLLAVYVGVAHTAQDNLPIKQIHWLGHASFRIDTADGNHIYIDPWKIPPDAPAANLILVTHDHFDHCSPLDIKRLRTAGTTIVAPKTAAAQLEGRLRIVKPGDQIQEAGVTIDVVPSYNLETTYHPQQEGYVGYILDVDGVRIYHDGDTDQIPEMSDFDVDVALLPVGGTYTMTASAAAQAARTLGSRLTIPMHYGTIIGSIRDAEQLRDTLLDELDVVILDAERP